MAAWVYFANASAGCGREQTRAPPPIMETAITSMASFEELAKCLANDIS